MNRSVNPVAGIVYMWNIGDIVVVNSRSSSRKNYLGWVTRVPESIGSRKRVTLQFADGQKSEQRGPVYRQIHSTRCSVTSTLSTKLKGMSTKLKKPNLQKTPRKITKIMIHCHTSRLLQMKFPPRFPPTLHTIIVHVHGMIPSGMRHKACFSKL